MNNLETIQKSDLPSGWRVVEFSNEDILTIEDGDRGSNYPKKNEFNDSGFCLFLNTGNVRKDGFQFIKNCFISEEKNKLLRKGKCLVPHNTHTDCLKIG
jgi:type I restriction enzyme S subunit